MGGWGRGDESMLKEALLLFMEEEQAERMARKISSRAGDFAGVLESARFRRDFAELSEEARLLLAMIPGLSRRIGVEQAGNHPLMDCISAAGQIAGTLYSGVLHETPCLFCLDGELRLIGYRLMDSGDMTELRLHMRDVARAVVDMQPEAVLLTHNHPSGKHHFSEDDVETTKKLMRLLSSMGVPLIDHLVVTMQQAAGMRIRRYIPEEDWRRQGPVVPKLGQWIR